MSAKSLKTLTVRSRGEWRTWLRANHSSESEIWLVLHKRHAAKSSVSYDDLVEEAICFGWIDSLVKRLDEERYARKFTPRKLDSKWSTINRRRYADLKARGLLQAPGIERPPTGRNGDAPRPSLASIPPHLEKQLKVNSQAWQNFEKLTLSQRRVYMGWVESAKRQETRERRLREVIAVLAAGKKLGLK